MHERAALGAGEHLTVDVLGVFLLAEDEPAARAPQRLVRRRCHEVDVLARIREQAGGYQSGRVGDIGHHPGADADGDGLHPREIDGARICRRTDYDELGTVLLGLRLHLVVVEKLGFTVHAVGNYVVELSRGS